MPTTEVKPYTAEEVDAFVGAYAVAALWSSLDDETPMDENYDVSDIALETLAAMREDCAAFVAANLSDLRAVEESGDYGSRSAQWTVPELAGHDFWLTRNGHGAGFWDRGLGEAGERLSEASRVYGGVDLYVGDDGQVWS